ncbi:hypothetical protein [Acinetobacter sp. GXMZU3951]
MATLTLQDTAALESLLFTVFAVGVFTGAICTGLLKRLSTIFFNEVERPKRIKTQQGFLYRYQGIYITKESRDTQVLAAREKLMNQYRMNPIKRRQTLHLFFWFLALFAFTIFLFIYTDSFTPLHLRK